MQEKLFFIFVNPQLPENMGAIARGLLNFRIKGNSVRFVAPLCDPLDPKAIATAAGAESVLKEAKIFQTLEEAISDCHKVYGTSATVKHMVKPYISLPTVMEEVKAYQAQNHIIGFIFGPERTGLIRDHLTLCHKVIQIPTNPEFSSLNLAQAVLLVAYEYQKTHIPPAQPFLSVGETNLATRQSLLSFFEYLERILDEKNYWRVSSKKPLMWQNLKNFFTRTDMTEQDIRTLRGVIQSLLNRPRS